MRNFHDTQKRHRFLTQCRRQLLLYRYFEFYLALMSTRLADSDAVAAERATHYCTSDVLARLEATLLSDTLLDTALTDRTAPARQKYRYRWARSMRHAKPAQ